MPFYLEVSEQKMQGSYNSWKKDLNYQVIFFYEWTYSYKRLRCWINYLVSSWLEKKIKKNAAMFLWVWDFRRCLNQHTYIRLIWNLLHKDFFFFPRIECLKNIVIKGIFCCCGHACMNYKLFLGDYSFIICVFHWSLLYRY